MKNHKNNNTNILKALLILILGLYFFTEFLIHPILIIVILFMLYIIVWKNKNKIRFYYDTFNQAYHSNNININNIEHDLEINPNMDTDAINRDNFLTISHTARSGFFIGNYFTKERDDSFGKMRKLSIILPVYIEYINQKQDFSKRKVEIFGIKTFEGRIYLYGFCHQKGKPRTFSLDNIQLLISENKEYQPSNIKSFVIEKLLPHIDSDYNKKVILNCLS